MWMNGWIDGFMSRTNFIHPSFAKHNLPGQDHDMMYERSIYWAKTAMTDGFWVEKRTNKIK